MVRGGTTLETSVGTILSGRYKVKSTLGSGGMAVVYKAQDAILGRSVALKTLHRHYAEVPSFQACFRQEARAMASLDHENIVKVYDISQDGEVPFIVVECVAGRDLGKLLRGDGRLSEAFVRRMGAQLLKALSYAHRRGIIHRDIKPSNILLTPEGTVKVADFGIARIIEEDDLAGGEPGEIVGSARYMSPEQLRGDEAMPESDIYSVGVLLYHCLTGKPPFSGDVKSLARQHMREQPIPPRRLNRKISPGMEATILKALDKDPANRYHSASAMLDDVEAEPPPAASRATEVAKSSSGGRRGGLVLASVLALLLLLGGGAALASGYVGLPQGVGGGFENALSRISPVEANAPAPPEAPQETATEPQETAATQQDPPVAEAAPQPAAPAAPVAETAARREPQRALVSVPDVTAYYDYYAADALAASGFDVVFAPRDYREGFDVRGVTYATEPAAGTLAPEGSTVTVYATPQDLPPQPVF